MELVDVYGFGHVLYEMTYGVPLLTASSKLNFHDCPIPEVKEILELILFDDVLSKKGPPTIDQLLEMPFFSSTLVDPLPSSSITAAASTSSASNSNNKLFSSSKMKELLVKARELSNLEFNALCLEITLLIFPVCSKLKSV